MKHNLRFQPAVILLTLVALPLIGCSTEPKTVDELMEQMAAKKADLKSYALDTDVNMYTMGMSVKMTMAMKGMGERIYGEADMGVMGQAIKMTMVVGDDGMMWMEIDAVGTKQVMKMEMAVLKEMGQQMLGGSLGPGMGMGSAQNPMDALTQYQEMYTFELGEPTEIDGTPVYTVKGSLVEDARERLSQSNPMAGQMMSSMERIVIQIRKSDLFPLDTQMLSEDGDVFMHMRNSNIEINPELDESLFEYTPPEGVEVMDMTEMMRAQQFGAPEEN